MNSRFEQIETTSPYREFNLYGGCEPVSETLLGRVTQWHPTGSVAYTRRVGSVVELTRFRLTIMAFDDEIVAKWFGLEIARLLVDSCYRDFVIERHSSVAATTSLIFRINAFE